VSAEQDRDGVPPLPQRFESIEPVGTTPFERTFVAFDNVLQRRVQLVLPTSGWDGWSLTARDRLLREARAMARIKHEGVAPVHWVEETGAGPLLVLDLPEGEPLGDRLSRGPLGVDETRELGIQLAAALAAVHYQSIVHRGIGPQTVHMLADGRVRIGAFTFAKEFDHRVPSSIDHHRRCEPKVAAHMPAYPAPEQFKRRGADPRADVYALGCLMFRCLTGVDPPTGQDGAHDADRELRRRRRDVPKDFAEVVRRCRLPDPTARYPTAQAVAEALMATRPGARPGRPALTRRVIAAGAGALGIIVLAQQLLPRDSHGGGRTPVPGPLPAPGQAAYGDTYRRCHALLIGISDYSRTEYRSLITPSREVREVRQRLLALGPQWQVEDIRLLADEKHGATSCDILSAIRELEQPDKVDKEDAVLFYFAGHGQEDTAQFSLIAADAIGKDPDSGGNGFIRNGCIKSFMETCPAKHMLLVLDCCDAAALLRFIPEPPVVGPQPAPCSENLRYRVRQIIAASACDEKAQDGPAPADDNLPLFARSVLAALDPAGACFAAGDCVTTRTLWLDVAGVMDKETTRHRKQTPVLSPSAGPSFVFFRAR
jgi:hypothetical protein